MPGTLGVPALTGTPRTAMEAAGRQGHWESLPSWQTGDKDLKVINRKIGKKRGVGHYFLAKPWKNTFYTSRWQTVLPICVCK